MDNLSINPSSPNFDVEFKKRTKRAIELTIKKGIKHPVFIDTIKAVKELFNGKKDIMNAKSADLSEYHLPFPKLTFISGHTLVDLTEESHKDISFVMYVTNAKSYREGKVSIHKKENALPVPDRLRHKQGKIELASGWTLTITFDILKDRDGEYAQFHAITDDTYRALYNDICCVISYFYPFCVDKEMFVVESQVARKKKGKIQTKGKSTYQLIHVSKIMKRFTPTGQPGQPLTKGHPRRAHKREYRDDRWTNMKGRSIIVKSTWVGPKTVLSEGRLYKVHTDVY